MSHISKRCNDSRRKLARTAFKTSRLLDFSSEKELTAQIGHPRAAWPLVALKELVDNALDACEDAGSAPEIAVTVDADSITVSDNGPGIPAKTVEAVLDFSVRVSSREAYVSPTRGAQGNALKTIVAMPFVLDGQSGRVEVAAHGIRHEIALTVDRIRQEPLIDYRQHSQEERPGTAVRIHWPNSGSNPHNGDTQFLQNGDGDEDDRDANSPSSTLESAKSRFLQFAADYTFLNPHLSLTVNWHGEKSITLATNPAWRKWLPTDPTCPHWYQAEQFERLIAAYVSYDRDRKGDRTVRAFVSEFRGYTGSAAQKKVLDATGLARLNLSELVKDNELDHVAIAKLLAAMKDNIKVVKPAALGIIGKEHLAKRFEDLGAEMESFKYKREVGETDGMPWVVETAFAWCPDWEKRRLVTGVNWSPGIINPFRELGRAGDSLDGLLQEQRAGSDEPVIVLLHMVCPRAEYTDRGKSAVVVEE